MELNALSPVPVLVKLLYFSLSLPRGNCVLTISPDQLTCVKSSALNYRHLNGYHYMRVHKNA